jgi:hypothetical protein
VKWHLLDGPQLPFNMKGYVSPIDLHPALSWRGTGWVVFALSFIESFLALSGMLWVARLFSADFGASEASRRQV